MISVGCIPEEFHAEIAANELQRDEWVRLFAIDEVSGNLITAGYNNELEPAFLKTNPTLVVDTQYFDAAFTARLLEAVGDVDEQTDGVLIQSENFQALTLIRARYRERVDCVYIDPPYNTNAGPIDYKNGYRSSSWMSLVGNRLGFARQLLGDSGVLCVTIDDYQLHELASLLDQEFGRDKCLGTTVIRNNPSGRSTVHGLSVCHEYALFYAKSNASLERLPRSKKQLERFSRESDAYVDWRNFRKDGGAVTHRAERPRQYYPIYVRLTDKTLRIPSLSWNRAEMAWDVAEQPAQGELQVLPIDEKGQDRVWSLNHISAMKSIGDLEVREGKDGAPQIYRRHRPSEGVLPRSWWDKKTYAAREHGSATLKHLFGTTPFSFAKSPYAVQDSLWVCGLAGESDRLVLDYFAGSGTTSHAVVNLNRGDGGRRRFILVEMADYFDTVLIPRIKKVTFTPEWKDGKPKRLANAEEAERSPRIVKVIRLESYEDVLNNLEIRRTPGQQLLLNSGAAQRPDGFKEQFILGYMLDVETRGSQSLLNLDAFADPTAYKLRVRRPGTDESNDVHVDLLETFNWLIGITVRYIGAPRTYTAVFNRDEEKRLRIEGRLRHADDGPYWFRTVTGTTPNGRRTLVIWRKLTGDPERDNLVLNEWFAALGYSGRGSEFDLVYVNGGNNLENIKGSADMWRVRLIEEDFRRLMFETET